MAKAKAKKPTPKKPVKKAAKPAAKKKAAPKKAAKPAAKKTSKPAAKKVAKPAAKKASKPAAKKSAPKKAVKKVAKKIAKPVAKKTAKAKPQPKKAAKKVVKKLVKKAAPAPKKAAVKAKPVAKPAAQKKGKKSKHIPGGGNVIVDHTHDSIVRYNDDELLEFKKLIDGKLVGAREELNNLKESLSNFTESQSGNKAWNMEEGTDTSEMEYLMNQISRQNKHIRDLEMALVRIENKTYGICRVTGSLIPKERLRVVPHATLSIEAKNARKPEYGAPPAAENTTTGPDFSEAPSSYED